MASVEGVQRQSLATRLEIELYRCAGDALKHDSNYLKKLDPPDRKLEVCRSLANFLCRELKRAQLDDGILEETVKQAIAALSYREALIYRDWQDAIGDAMLELDPDSVRRYKIVGYERFEKILEGKSLWIEVFRESINDIDFEAIDPNDFRSKQLKALALATAEILIHLAQSEAKDLIQEPVLQIARTIALPDRS